MKNRLELEEINNIMQSLVTSIEEVDEMSERLENAVQMINKTFGEVANIIDDIMA